MAGADVAAVLDSIESDGFVDLDGTTREVVARILREAGRTPRSAKTQATVREQERDQEAIAAAQRIAAAGLAPRSIEIEDVNGDAKLTARSPEGVRWVRLCCHLGARMLEPWEGMPEAARDLGPKASDEGSGA